MMWQYGPPQSPATQPTAQPQQQQQSQQVGTDPSPHYPWSGQWSQWGREGWQPGGAYQWQKPGVEAWAGQAWVQQGGSGEGGRAQGEQDSSYQQNRRETGEEPYHSLLCWCLITTTLLLVSESLLACPTHSCEPHPLAPPTLVKGREPRKL